jgi:hypothetical protein
MSRREALGVIPSAKSPNTHNAQKPPEPRICADIADSAYRDSGAA